MIPTAAQLITIVILLVPGFLSIQVFSNLTPTKKLSSFDATVLSIVFSLLIHGTYTICFAYLNTDCVNELMDMIAKKRWSEQMFRLVGFYTFGLLLYSVLLGYGFAYVKEKGRLYRFIHWLGFDYSQHENLWDEVIYLYKLKGKTPVIIVHMEGESYAGSVHRASFDLVKSERKELILLNPRYKKETDDIWTKLTVDLVYLDMGEIKSVHYVNGDHILD